MCIFHYHHIWINILLEKISKYRLNMLTFGQKIHCPMDILTMNKYYSLHNFILLYSQHTIMNYMTQVHTSVQVILQHIFRILYR